MLTGAFSRGFVSGLVFLLAFPFAAAAQSPSEKVEQHFRQVRTGKHPEAPSFEELSAGKQKKMLDKLENYYQDTNRVIRREAYKLTHELGQTSSLDRIRASAAGQLVNGLEDPDAGMVGYIAGKLPQYSKDAFGEEARKKLRKVVLNDPPHFNTLVKLGGYLEISALRTPLIRKIRKTGMSSQEMWAAHLALARLGEPRATDYLVKKIRKMEMGDNVVEELLPGLAYTCSKPAFDYMETLIRSDKKQCTSPDPHRSGNIKCAYRVLEVVTPYIKGFPLEQGPMGGLDTDDYEQALKKARKWFRENENYRLDRKVY